MAKKNFDCGGETTTLLKISFHCIRSLIEGKLFPNLYDIGYKMQYGNEFPFT